MQFLQTLAHEKSHGGCQMFSAQQSHHPGCQLLHFLSLSQAAATILQTGFLKNVILLPADSFTLLHADTPMASQFPTQKTVLMLFQAKRQFKPLDHISWP